MSKKWCPPEGISGLTTADIVSRVEQCYDEAVARVESTLSGGASETVKGSVGTLAFALCCVHGMR